ncbi:ATP-binding protein [Arcobacter arenosus]|uniref:ATP-binding protein n=1 Tax=Arcobacter arenosus TaxID=2576037 RepID=A0A5R8Y294_9BACT|nr:ATP-binding protein [Arcobacter arenosus]TLP39383.1 ATP-binding protein [Arcobacter arenosus]
MKDVFKRLITDFIEKNITGIISRDYQIPLNSKKIISLIGVRRSGKSSILFDIVHNLRKTTPRENIIYINFEDDRLYPLELKSLDLLLESYFELYPNKKNEKIYLFLDEVQVVENWEAYVRRIYDNENISIYITGSSAKLLSSEIATSLRGRTISYEIFPFSFKEYLRYKQIDINIHSSKSLSFIKNALETYLIDGGFAETINEDNTISRKILSDYLELIVYKDIVDRYNITNRSLLKTLNKYCFTNIATLISFNKLYNEFKSQGFKLSKDTIFNYVSHLEDAYTLFSVPIYRNSIKEEQRNPKKIYAIDNGFKKIYDYAIGEDKSKLYENIVFLHLRNQTKEIYYFKEKQEVDFYAKIEGKEFLVNVSVKIENEKTKQRETKGLLEAMNYFDLNESYLITQDEDETIQIEDKKIFVLPLYKFLLEV